MDFVEKLEDILDERHKQLCFDCNQVYFMADLKRYIPEDEWPEDCENFDEEPDLSKEEEQYMILEPCNTDFHYMSAENLLFGLSEYLDESYDGLSQNDVPLISYEVTKENKLLFTCYVNKELELKSKPDKGIDDYKKLTVVKRLKQFLEGQISDGWGESGLYLYYFMGCPAIIANPKNLRQVEKKFKNLFSSEYHWKDVK